MRCEGQAAERLGKGRPRRNQAGRGWSQEAEVGREGYAGDWPSDRRVWTIAAFFVALLTVVAIYAYHYEPVCNRRGAFT